jgi:4-hydroxybenzoyl-CoA reductase subunit gamma
VRAAPIAMPKRLVRITVNGRVRDSAVADHALLIDYLREDLGLTGTKRGCDGGECGACTVLVDGAPRLACITLAARCDGGIVQTIESLAENGRMSRLQRAFHEKLGTQCGFCTPGMILKAYALLIENPKATRAEIVSRMEDNLCRCGSHKRIVDAVEQMKGGAL